VTSSPSFRTPHDLEPLTRFGRALEESAIELLAVDQRPLPSGPRRQARPHIERTQLSPEARLHLRLLEQKRRALAKTRDTAERKLEAAERELDRCSPLRRGRRDQLRAEIGLQRRAIELAGEQLTATATLIEQTRLDAREPRARARPERGQTLRHRREPPGLRLER
jgi:hypothetical protein